MGTKIYECSSPLYKMTKYFQITYTHPFVHFKSSLDYFKCLIQSKNYVNGYYILCFLEPNDKEKEVYTCSVQTRLS